MTEAPRASKLHLTAARGSVLPRKLTTEMENTWSSSDSGVSRNQDTRRPFLSLAKCFQISAGDYEVRKQASIRYVCRGIEEIVGNILPFVFEVQIELGMVKARKRFENGGMLQAAAEVVTGRKFLIIAA
ncbi:hypothetical protein R1sor_004532 [Riccia sorocarpa]|uniref:Histone H2A n=1 Tax=Riccia sorocarpa TaxID=122646 RepID=A0ABD3HL97_9MARC